MGALSREPYDASEFAAAEPGRDEAGADPARQAELRLERALDRMRDQTAAHVEELEENGVDPAIERLLEQVTGAESAPLTFRSLRARVHQGRLTWTDFWSDPSAEAGGLDVFRAVLRAHLEAS